MTYSPHQVWIGTHRPLAEIDKACTDVAAWVARHLDVPIAEVDVEVARELAGTRVTAHWWPR